MRAGQVMAADDHGQAEWRCMVAGCPIYGVWHAGPHAPSDALGWHYEIHHRVNPS